ncbi:MAG: helix-turn-helix domain-containing protein [Synergistaceae bacterium]|jgi:transcriptional regulator with XRE-family HTH domain|nr:helix-turn-helix domain-containing protein [Synergistaceae bacterium]
MNNILSIKQNLAQRVRQRRREARLSQKSLADRSAVSFGSVKRFERTGEISLASLLRIAIVLGCDDDFNQLFSRRNYQSLDEILDEK